ncbi:hypothetical protein ACFWBF_08790 [Streptomyces sp. NPDC060028]|uniref:hypothetical protein n=1 Tax=Streptomyces sp. NPDC060028 TaxID=3347041 RepID=UPI0036791D11
MTESRSSANSETSTANSRERSPSSGRATGTESTGHLTSVAAPAAERTKAAANSARKSLGSATRQTLGKATAAWTVVKARKATALGAGAATVAVTAGSYAVGRRAGLRRRGPLSRLTGGRL